MAHDVFLNSAGDEAPTPHAVFISYSSKDQETGDAICRTLEAQGIRCWIAHRDIPGGNKYPGAIITAISASGVFVLVFSSNSNSSNDVMSEVETAFQKGIPILPFRVENVQPSLDLQYFLSTPQFLNAYTPPLEFHLENLVDAVAALLKTPRKTKRKASLNPIQFKIAAGVGLALVIVALLLLNPFKFLVKSGSNANANVAIDNPPVDHEKQYGEAIDLLSSPELAKRLEGIRRLDKIIESGDEYLYWKAMTQLTAHVKQHSPWTGNTDEAEKQMAPDIAEILRVITARPPLYPASFTAEEKEKKRRELKRTDLRGLRLVDKAHFEYVDLEGANLENAVLTGANLEGTMLKDALLMNAQLGGTCLEGADLGGADLFGANLRTANEACVQSAGTKPRGLTASTIMVACHWECAAISDELRKKIEARLPQGIPACLAVTQLPPCSTQ